MKKFVIGMAIGAVVGTVFGVVLEGYGVAKLAIEDGVDISAFARECYERGKHDSEQVIHSWRRKYSTPTRKR